MASVQFSAASTAASSREEVQAAQRWAGFSEHLLETFGPEALDQARQELEAMLIAANEFDEGEYERLSGDKAPSPEERATARLVSLYAYFERRRQLLRDTLSASEVSALLKVSRQTPHDRADQHRLLEAREAGQRRFPTWQFDPEGPNGTINGLPAVLQALQPLPALAQLAWFQTPQPLLGNMTPVDALRSGRIDDVLDEARVVAGQPSRSAAE